MHDKQMNDASVPGPTAPPALTEGPHVGVRQIGEQGDEGRKAFYIHIEAKPGREEEVLQMMMLVLPSCTRTDRPGNRDLSSTVPQNSRRHNVGTSYYRNTTP